MSFLLHEFEKYILINLFPNSITMELNSYMIRPDPVIVVLETQTSIYTYRLRKIWPEVSSNILKVYPNIRICFVESSNCCSNFDQNIFPTDLKQYFKWTPMVLLIPGKLWDTAMQHLGPNNPIKIKEGVQIFNAEWDTPDDFIYTRTYNYLDPEDYAKWIKTSLNHPDFLKVQFY